MCQNIENNLILRGKIEFEGKTCQNAENKQTFDLTRKIEFGGKTLQNIENKQNFSGKIEFEVKTRQKAENKQTFDLTRKIIFRVSFLNLASNSRQIPDFFCKNSVNALFSKKTLSQKKHKQCFCNFLTFLRPKIIKKRRFYEVNKQKKELAQFQNNRKSFVPVRWRSGTVKHKGFFRPERQ